MNIGARRMRQLSVTRNYHYIGGQKCPGSVE